MDLSKLTPTELEVFEDLVMNGKGLTKLDELAKWIGIARGTVTVHLYNIYEKCGVHSRAELLYRFYRENILGEENVKEMSEMWKDYARDYVCN